MSWILKGPSSSRMKGPLLSLSAIWDLAAASPEWQAKLHRGFELSPSWVGSELGAWEHDDQKYRAMIPLGQREEELGGGRFSTWAVSLSSMGYLSRGNPFNLPCLSKCILPSRKCTILHQNCLSYASLSPCSLQSARNGEEALTWCKSVVVWETKWAMC